MDPETTGGPVWGTEKRRRVRNRVVCGTFTERRLMCEEGEEKRSGLLVCWWGDEAVMCRPGQLSLNCCLTRRLVLKVFMNEIKATNRLPVLSSFTTFTCGFLTDVFLSDGSHTAGIGEVSALIRRHYVTKCTISLNSELQRACVWPRRGRKLQAAEERRWNYRGWWRNVCYWVLRLKFCLV